MPKLTLILKNLLITIVAAGTVTVLVPYLLMRSRLPHLHVELEAARVIGLLPLIAGVLVYLWCVWGFMGAHGTPAPIDAPNELVVKGLYRYVRNPMYVGILLIIIGEAIFFAAGLLALYALVSFLVVHWCGWPITWRMTPPPKRLSGLRGASFPPAPFGRPRSGMASGVLFEHCDSDAVAG